MSEWPYEVMSKMCQEKKFSDFVVSSNGHSFPPEMNVMENLSLYRDKIGIEFETNITLN